MIEIFENKLPPNFKNWSSFYLFAKEQGSNVLENFFIDYVLHEGLTHYTVI